jgi:hypothetical protein
MDNANPFLIAIVAATIAGFFTIIGVVLGFGLEHASRYLAQRKKTRRHFLEIRGLMLSAPLNNLLYPSLYPLLRRMKHFFVKHPQFLKHPANDKYFRKWLTDPFLDTDIKTTRWEDSKIEEMLNDLSETKV